jgi:hypothetical protein
MVHQNVCRNREKLATVHGKFILIHGKQRISNPVDRVKSNLGYFARFVLRLFSWCKNEYIVKEDLDTRDRSTPKNVTLIVLLEPYYSLHISFEGHY